MNKRRADVTLVERGFFESRARAQESIAAGLVSVAGRVLRKASEPIGEGQQIVAREPYPWVSRGGVKLEAALDAFGLDPRDKICLDVGASTGGFSHVLLSRGARRVYALDVGHGQLHERLRVDPRLTSLERQDARALRADQFESPPQFVVCDVSFISLELALPRPLSLAGADAQLVALIKPQFEVGPGRVKKGLVRDQGLHESVCARIADFLRREGWRDLGTIPSPIAGGDGNAEFLIAAQRARADAPLVQSSVVR